MLRDAETFKTRLGALDGAGNSGEIVLEAVKNKQLAPAERRTPPMVPQISIN